MLLNSGEISREELDFLLRFPFVPNLTSPVEFLTNQLWGGIKALVNMDVFRYIQSNTLSSKKMFDQSCNCTNIKVDVLKVRFWYGS